MLRDLLGAREFRGLIAEWDGKLAGYAIYFKFYSRFEGRPGLFLEDIFVRAEFRKKGIGKEFMARAATVAGRKIMRPSLGSARLE